MDALVLSVVAGKSTDLCGIRQVEQSVMEVSESTLYPVLRRLQKSECLETYDREFAGRNRRYYSITEKGCEQLETYRREWTEYKAKIDNVLFGGISNE